MLQTLFFSDSVLHFLSPVVSLPNYSCSHSWSCNEVPTEHPGGLGFLCSDTVGVRSVFGGIGQHLFFGIPSDYEVAV